MMSWEPDAEYNGMFISELRMTNAEKQRVNVHGAATSESLHG
jgi:hypothetical protein